MARTNRSTSVPAPAKMAKRAARSAAKPVKDETMDNTTNGADPIVKVIAEATEHAKASIAKSQQMAGELGEFNKGNVEAIVESSKIVAKGLEQFGQSAAAYARNAFEEAQTQARTLAAAGSATEFFKLQGDFARSSFDRMVADASKNTEAVLKFAGEVAQPISNRVALAADRMKIAA